MKRGHFEEQNYPFTQAQIEMRVLEIQDGYPVSFNWRSVWDEGEVVGVLLSPDDALTVLALVRQAPGTRLILGELTEDA